MVECVIVSRQSLLPNASAWVKADTEFQACSILYPMQSAGQYRTIGPLVSSPEPKAPW